MGSFRSQVGHETAAHTVKSHTSPTSRTSGQGMVFRSQRCCQNTSHTKHGNGFSHIRSSKHQPFSVLRCSYKYFYCFLWPFLTCPVHGFRRWSADDRSGEPAEGCPRLFRVSYGSCHRVKCYKYDHRRGQGAQRFVRQLPHSISLYGL